MDILDASALLAFIKKEKGYEKIEKLFIDAEKSGSSLFISQINYIEFIYKIRQNYNTKQFNNIVADLQSPLLGIMNYFDAEIGFYVAYLKATYHMSLADAIGLASSKIMKGRFWTADRALAEIAKKERIELQLFR